MPEGKETELETFLRMYRGYTDEQIIENSAGCREGTTRRLAAEYVIRARADAAARSELLAIRQDVGDIRARLRSSEWRTFTLWFALIALIVAALSLARDYLRVERASVAPAAPAVAPASADSKARTDETVVSPATPPPQ